MSNVTVRAATTEDRAAWIRLRYVLWPDCPEEKHRIEIDQLLRSDGVVLLAEKGTAALIGFAEVSLRRVVLPGAVS